MTVSMDQQLADYGEHLQHLVEHMDVPAAAEFGAGLYAPPARGWRPGWAVAVAAFAVSLLVGGVALLVLDIGDEPPPADEPPVTTVAPTPTTVAQGPSEKPWPPSIGSEEIPGPVAAYEGLVVDKLGLRVPLDPPFYRTRAGFLARLDAEGWASHTDNVVGWSIRYPADWTVGEGTEPGRRLVLLAPPAEDGLIITLALDAAPDDASSYDYHVGYIERAVAAGELYPVLDEQTVDDYWTPIDVDFDGRFDPQDITGTDFYRAVDDDGNPLPDGHPLGNFWGYAYYDPAAEPAYGYLFETFGINGFNETELWRHLDWVITSFEPPDGYP